MGCLLNAETVVNGCQTENIFKDWHFHVLSLWSAIEEIGHIIPGSFKQRGRMFDIGGLIDIFVL